MAELVLSTVGRALGASLPGVLGRVGGILGQVGGAVLGGAIDQRLFGERIHREGARLTDLHLQGSSEGASIPAVYGAVRIAGQVIWAARFKEHAHTSSTGAGGKGGGASVTRTEYSYSISFAVGLCEGAVARIGRVWANGELLDLSTVAWRLHAGGKDQAPDPLIEAIEGETSAPAYRDLAYVVFEDLPLERFGNTIPQLSFEVIRPAPSEGEGLRDLARGVCLIPGCGEFAYATAPVRRLLGPGRETLENVHLQREQANFLAALDQLKADLPNCDYVLLVCAWFGDDLRCGACTIMPGVEIEEKQTAPLTWRAGGVTRDGARLISRYEGGPAYGGTPDDVSLIQAMAALKARGYKVGLYPFLLMDVPPDNALPDPYGGVAQKAYPWRGRLSLHPAAGQAGSPDKTGAAAVQIGHFFGTAAASDFGEAGGAPTYSGPPEWSYRRFILHYAKLAAIAGGVDAFLLGSELRGLTTARDGAASYPAVAALKALAGDVRAMLGAETIITYAADWSEYSGHQPQDGSGDVIFHLDPLWADDNIDVVGVDWYPPLTDWRDGGDHLDAAEASRAHDPAYLRGRIEAGEAYEWYYASAEDRAAQTRTPISDGAHGEPWIYRAKDIRSFWGRAHHDRPGGVRSATPTPWAPQSKPIWLVELGCPAVDKGANAPNVFIDPKSSESGLPPFSSGARDDLIQRRTLEAYLRHWHGADADNPVSALTGAPMVAASFLWCWDARPFPAFPARQDVWADGLAWRLGHWLTGRAASCDLGEVVNDLCRRAAFADVDVSGLTGVISGFVADGPASVRAHLEPLMSAYDFAASETSGAIRFFHPEQSPIEVSWAALTAPAVAQRYAERGDPAGLPIEARVRFLDAAKQYLIASVSARRLDRAEGGVESLDAPLVLEPGFAEAMAQRLLADRRAAMETLQLELGPAALALEPGDRLKLDGGGAFDIVRIEDAEARRLELRRAREAAPVARAEISPDTPVDPAHAPAPVFEVLDLPPLPGDEMDARPRVAVFAAPWRGPHALYAGLAGAPLTQRAIAQRPAIMGELLWSLWPGPVGRWDEGNRVRVRLYEGAPASVNADAVLSGANAFAIANGGDWEIVQARRCVLVGEHDYELSGFLRGVLGSAHAMGAPHPVGARIVKLDARLPRLNVAAHEWREPLSVATPPHGALAEDTRAAHALLVLPNAAERPWAPAHLRVNRIAGGDVRVRWVRCARLGDSWGPGEPPLGFAAERYLVAVLEGGENVRQAIVSAPVWTYSAADQAADFGGLPTSVHIRVAQMDDGERPGLNKELTITL